MYPDKTAFIHEDRRFTFAELDARVNRLIHALNDLGLEKGDRVAILAKNCLPYMEVYGSSEKGGLVTVPLNFRLSGPELARIVNDSGASALFVSQEYVSAIEAIRGDLPTVEHLICLDGEASGMQSHEALLANQPVTEPRVTVTPDDLAYIMYTSGTTGRPKGAMLTHRGQVADSQTMLMELGLRPSDSHLAVMPFFHVGGRALPLTHFYRGCTTVVSSGFDPAQALSLIEHHRLTTIQVVPTMIAFMLDSPDLERFDTSSLNMIFYASSPMPVELLRRAIAKFGQIFVQGYGQTESGPLTTLLGKENHVADGTPEQLRRLASCGRAVMNVAVRVVDAVGRDVSPGAVGELVCRSELNMAGYWNNAAATAEAVRDGWLYTGDMATMDDDSYFYIVDRKKDMIISGGENIYPREVEEVLYTHQAVLEAAVIGVPDAVWGEAVKALVVLKQRARASEEELIAHCKAHLASYKKPKSVEFRKELPKTPSGKILKRALREKYWAGQTRRI
jgi:acyl-CoA synthetase (AMP-forming)/AMP-acid ligase II